MIGEGKILNTAVGEPFFFHGFGQYDGHSVFGIVNFGHQRIGFGGDDRKGGEFFPTFFVGLVSVDAAQCHNIGVG